MNLSEQGLIFHRNKLAASIPKAKNLQERQTISPQYRTALSFGTIMWSSSNAYSTSDFRDCNRSAYDFSLACINIRKTLNNDCSDGAFIVDVGKEAALVKVRV
jgi:hypothetical protein